MSSEDLTGYVPSQDTSEAESDPAALNAAEDLDEDRIRKDPLEAGMDPPENWSGVTKYGMTPYEESHPRPLADRLAEEQPDVTADRPAGEPAGEPVDQADEDVVSLDHEAVSQDGDDATLERLDQPEELVRADPDTLSREDEIRAEAVGRGQASDDY
ncbi:hypothetical protein ACFFSW_28705 [Saccharothrix longispora]|uniref:DUF5709 domain-containing protein n=1 Tax=Saccharothrix longispora TaxID=33920 RepID=A0ABU1PSN7_9PSEU|nr:hypothetical protein [Saccharothrix longispora]MDR6593293.1 hypothetical protein [Saccharothrix longispora]